MSQDVARTLCLREPGARYAFSLRIDPEPLLGIRPARRQPPGRDAEPGPADPFSGAIVVDPDSRLVFLAPAEPTELLTGLATWARGETVPLAAAAPLIGAGAVQWTGDANDPASVNAIDLTGMAIRRDDDLWAGIARPGPARVAAVLDASLPGERLWYWLTETPGATGVPFLVQKVAGDPNRDAINAMLDDAEVGSSGRAVTGIGYATEDGVFQFLGGGLTAAHVGTLARWVRGHFATHPALARLSGCRLVNTGAGVVRDVVEDATLWTDIPRPAAPGTVAETDAILESMAPRAPCWFWATTSAPGGAFLSLAPINGDRDGAAFRSRIAGFLRRFPGSHATAVAGSVRRARDGALRFTAAHATADWAELRANLVRLHPERADMLGRAELVVSETSDVRA